MFSDQKIWIGQSDSRKNIYLYPSMANRHGLIAGATGTGKTITMKVLAESFSDMGVPVFFSDVKGDLSGMCRPGADTEDMRARIERFGIEGFEFKAYPTRFWDIFGEVGHPVRVTVSGMGPMLLSRLLNLTEVQSGVLSIVFKVADDNGLLLLDLKDLRAMLQYVGDNRAEFTTMYGNVSTASIGAIQRALLAFEAEGGEGLFGEPELDIRDWMRTDFTGRGYINILTSTRLINSPTVYATFLLWLMTELFEKLPEVGDVEKPRVVFFFDEAHFLFTDAPKALVQKIVQVVKLVRSKGVGVYFVTQSPSDIPDDVLAQLSNRIQHALRAYTPAEHKAVRAAASAFRVNPEFNTEEAIMALGVGQALVSCLDEKGVPTIVERARILPPQSLMGAADESFVQSTIAADEFDLKYRDSVDRESAYEIIMKATEELKAQKEAELEAAKAEKEAAKAEKEAAKAEKEAAKSGKKTSSKAGTAVKKAGQKAVNSAASSVATAVGNNLINSVTGGKKTSTSTIAKRAAGNALKSLMRSGTSSIIRGLFGNIK
ncbi:MAG: DUF853 domain-containing protein [Oscillospiraceae bacterium]|nr:DUF853 domain-containing protein [Oscillospiraceae bacterium]